MGMPHRTGPIDDRHVTAFHPGPDADFRFAPRPPESDAQRLARYEAEFIDAAIERHVHNGGRLGSLAVQIITLRASAGK